jgi:hypothetical protein
VHCALRAPGPPGLAARPQTPPRPIRGSVTGGRRELATATWDSRSGAESGRNHADKCAADDRSQLGCCEEVDVQPGLWAGAVANREAAVFGVFLQAIVGVLHVGLGSVDPHAKQPVVRNSCRGRAEVLVSLAARAVLKHLDPDDEVVLRRRREGVYVADDQVVAESGAQHTQTRDRLRRDATPIRSRPPSTRGRRLRPFPQPIYSPLVIPHRRAAASMSFTNGSGGSCW